MPGPRPALPGRHLHRRHAVRWKPPVLHRARDAGAELGRAARAADRRPRRRRLRGRRRQPDRRTPLRRPRRLPAAGAAAPGLARADAQRGAGLAGDHRAAAGPRPGAGPGLRPGRLSRGDPPGRAGAGRDQERHAQPGRLQPRPARRGRADPAAAGHDRPGRRRRPGRAAGRRGPADHPLGDGGRRAEAASLPGRRNGTRPRWASAAISRSTPAAGPPCRRAGKRTWPGPASSARPRPG